MINKTETYCLLDVEDIEKAVSIEFGQKVSISEMDVRMFDSITIGGEKSTFFNIEIKRLEDLSKNCDGSTTSDIFDKANWPDFTLNKTSVFIPEKYIFNFSTDLFHSYIRSAELSFRKKCYEKRV